MYRTYFNDNPKTSLEARVNEGIKDYKERFGNNTSFECCVNLAVPEAECSFLTQKLGVRISRAKNVPQNYIWIGKP